jgi:hypothetical protein
MKVVFLDIDGVINSMDFLHAWHGLQKARGEELRRFDRFGDQFDPRCIMNLENILRRTNSKIVISSVWRFSGLEEMQQMWWERKIFGEIIGVTRRDKDGFRGNEVKDWLDNNPVENYVILDDDTDFLDEQKSHFIKVDSIFGLNWGDAEKAVNILSPSPLHGGENK